MGNEVWLSSLIFAEYDHLNVMKSLVQSGVKGLVGSYFRRICLQPPRHFRFCSKISRMNDLWARLAPRVSPAETRMAVHRWFETYQTTVKQPLDLRRSMILVVGLLFLVILCIMRHWFVTFKCFMSYWSSVLYEHHPRRSTKTLFSTRVRVRQNVEKSWIFRIQKDFPNLWSRILSWINAIVPAYLRWCDLLYESPAQTRLTVYRRFDIPNRGGLPWSWTREDP